MNIKTLSTVMAFALAASSASSAVIFEGGEGAFAGTVLNGGAGQVQQRLTVDGASIDFQWNDTSPNYLAYSTFTTGSDFSLTFDDYAPQSDPVNHQDQRSGFQLYLGTFAALGAPELAGSGCGDDVLTAFGSTDCVLVTGAGNAGTSFVTPDETYGLFSAGTYTLMFSEGNMPNFGSAEFTVSEVPLPAGGLLLLSGLGGLAAMRRRKQRA